MMEGPGADSEEKHEPVSDIDTVVVVVGLKALDPEWPIREAIGAQADIARTPCVAFDPFLPKYSFPIRTEQYKLCGKSSCHFRQGCPPFVRQRIWRLKLWTSFFHQMLSLEILHERIYRFARNSHHICHVSDAQRPRVQNS